MSKIALSGSPTGTGVFTIESPSSNTSRTLVLPDEAGTVALQGGAGVGKVIQVVSAENTTRATTYGNVLYDVVTLNITPTNTSNTILLIGQFSGACGASYDQTNLYFRRNTTNIGVGTASGYGPTSSKIFYDGTGSSAQLMPHLILVRDNPATTSQITYRMTVTDGNNDNTIYINRSARDLSANLDPSGYSTIVAMEIGA